jgi:GTPase KRas protein
MLEILDTTHEEEYTALRDQWIRDAEGFLLVYSITSRSSFCRVTRLHHQIKLVKETSFSYDFSPDPSKWPIMLVGNHRERVSEREVPTAEGHALARELGCDFIEASSTNGINVEKAFCDVVREIRRQRQTRLDFQDRIRPIERRRKYPWSSDSAQNFGGISQILDSIRAKD